MVPLASWIVLEAIAEPIGAHIRTGAPKAVIIGCLAGWTKKRAISPPQLDLLTFRDEKMTITD